MHAGRSRESSRELNLFVIENKREEHMALSKISFCEYDFVQAAISKEDYECPVCFEILKNPFLTACCGNHFCEACIEATKVSTNSCPFCESKPINGIVDRKLQRRINEMEVYCLHKKHGCSWAGTMDELTKHLAADNVNGCTYSLIPCSFSCGNQLSRHDFSKHVREECHLRPYICTFCGFSSTYADVSKHYSICLAYPVLCPNSCTKEKMKRGDLDRHLSSCPNELVSCFFSDMGCTVERIKRCHLRQHMEASWLQHQLMMCDAFKQLKKENEMLKKDNEELRKAHKTADHWINGYKLMAQGVMKTHWREYLFSLAVVSTNIPEPVCPVILKWSGYEAIMRNAKEGRNEFYYMRPFYTYVGGYRMQLRVHPNGTNNGKNTHMSVHCHLMPGRNDDSLIWPFKGTICVSILNQVEDTEHIFKEVWSYHHDIPDTVTKKPAGIRNEKGWGYAQFARLSEIEDFTATRQYLMNDALFFRISAL